MAGGHGMIRTERLSIVPFEMKYLKEYYMGFNEEITKYQWPDPFGSMDDAKGVLQGFLDEMGRGETLIFSILSEDAAFLGSVEVHGLMGDCPELGIWIMVPRQNKGYAYEALAAVLSYVRSRYGKDEFYYEADARNIGSVKLLQKFGKEYGILAGEAEKLITESGKKLELQGYILKAK